MKTFFTFSETLELVNNGVLELGDNTTNAQRVSHKDVKKKYFKVAYCIQSAIDAANFDWIYYVESTKETCDILIKYYEGCEKFKVVKLHTFQWQCELLQMGKDKKDYRLCVKGKESCPSLEGLWWNPNQ